MAMAQKTIPKLVGFFINEFNNSYEYYKTEDAWDVAHGFEYRIYVGSSLIGLETRPVKLLKTIVYVGVDEDGHGNPIIEKWKIKKHFVY